MENEMTMTSFLRLLRLSRACDAGYEYCKQFSTPKEALENMQGEWLSWLMRRGEYLCLSKYVTWDRLDEVDWQELLVLQPQFIDKCPIKELTKETWAIILKYQPQLIKHCDVSKLTRVNMLSVLFVQPHLITHFDVSNFVSIHWKRLLIEQPSLIEHCDVSKINDDDWTGILYTQPQLEEYRND